MFFINQSGRGIAGADRQRLRDRDLHQARRPPSPALRGGRLRHAVGGKSTRLCLDRTRIPSFSRRPPAGRPCESRGADLSAVRLVYLFAGSGCWRLFIRGEEESCIAPAESWRALAVVSEASSAM